MYQFPENAVVSFNAHFSLPSQSILALFCVPSSIFFLVYLNVEGWLLCGVGFCRETKELTCFFKWVLYNFFPLIGNELCMYLTCYHL